VLYVVWLKLNSVPALKRTAQSSISKTQAKRSQPRFDFYSLLSNQQSPQPIHPSSASSITLNQRQQAISKAVQEQLDHELKHHQK